MTLARVRHGWAILEANGRGGSLEARLPDPIRQWAKPVSTGLTILLLVIAIWGLWRWWTYSMPDYPSLDLGHYLDATRRWLVTGTPYLPHEVAGPYEHYSPLTFLHPPITLYLFLPFLYVPAPLFWIIPLGIVAILVVAWRPHHLVWPLLALSLCTDGFRNAFVTGNTDLWMLMAVAAGLGWAWPAVVAVIKPTFAPIALLALRRRSGQIALVIVVVAAVPMGNLWIEWWHVIQNGPGGLWYSLPNYLWVAAPALAWVFRTADLSLVSATRSRLTEVP